MLLRTPGSEMGAELIETTAVEMEAPAAGTLFRTDDPAEVIVRATRVANALAPVIEQRKLFATIQRKRHIIIEGWQTLGAMLGVTPVCTWTRPLENGWEARVEAHTLDGRVIGAAEAECLRAESLWARSDDYAIRSMAQTRAASKALSSVLRFIVILAGFEGTPAEEMSSEPRVAQQQRPVAQKQPQRPPRPVDAPVAMISSAMRLLNVSAITAEEGDAIVEWRCGVTDINRAPANLMSSMIEVLEKDGAEAILANLKAKANEGNERALKIMDRHLGAPEPLSGEVL